MDQELPSCAAPTVGEYLAMFRHEYRTQITSSGLITGLGIVGGSVVILLVPQQWQALAGTAVAVLTLLGVFLLVFKSQYQVWKNARDEHRTEQLAYRKKEEEHRQREEQYRQQDQENQQRHQDHQQRMETLRLEGLEIERSLRVEHQRVTDVCAAEHQRLTDLYNAEVAKNARPDLRGQARYFHTSGTTKTTLLDDKSCTAQVQFQIAVTNIRPAFTTLREVLIDGSAMSIPASFERVTHWVSGVGWTMQAVHPELPFGQHVELNISTIAVIEGYWWEDLGETLRLKGLKVQLVDSFGDAHAMELTPDNASIGVDNA